MGQRDPLASNENEIDRMAEALPSRADTTLEIDEKNLREVAQARRRLIDAIESISEGFALYDADDRLVLCNPRFREILHLGDADAVVPGMRFETIVRRCAERGLVKEAASQIDTWVAEQVAAHCDPRGPQIQQHSSGRWIQVSEHKIAGGGTAGVYTDITELKHIEERLQESLARYDLAMRGSNEGLWDWDARTDELHISSRFRELSGVDAVALRTTPSQWLGNLHPDDVEAYRRVMRAHLRGETAFSGLRVPRQGHRRSLSLGAGAWTELARRERPRLPQWRDRWVISPRASRSSWSYARRKSRRRRQTRRKHASLPT